MFIKCHGGIDFALSCPCLHVGEIHAARDEERTIVRVGESVSGIVHHDVGVAVHCFGYVFEPFHSFFLDLGDGGVCEDFHMSFGHAEGAHEILFDYQSVSVGVFAVWQGGLVGLVGDDYHESVAVAIGDALWNVIFNEFVVNEFLIHISHVFVEGFVDGEFHAASAVLRAFLGVGTCGVKIVVLG